MRIRSIAASFTRIVGAVVVILVLSVGLFVWSGMDWYPIDVLAWHAQHGHTARIGDFNVPLSTWVRPDPHYGGLRFNLRPGGVDQVSVELGRKITPGNRWKETLEACSKSADPKIAAMAKNSLAMKATKVMIADQPSFCIEDEWMVHCIPENEERGLTVDYFGPWKLRPIFYEMLSRITRTAPK